MKNETRHAGIKEKTAGKDQGKSKYHSHDRFGEGGGDDGHVGALREKWD